jgi:hypothetical protein
MADTPPFFDFIWDIAGKTGRYQQRRQHHHQQYQAGIKQR